MTGYTITITPDDERAGALTTIRVDTATGGPRITELTVRPADGMGLSAHHQLPDIDLVQLVGALSPSRPGILEAAPSRAAEQAADVVTTPTAPSAPGTTGRSAGRRPPARKTATRKAAKAPARRATAKAARATAGADSTRRSTAGRRRAADATATSNAAQSTGGRAYRRMPDANDVVAAYRQAGTTSALAEHYGVPRHTAVGWVRRLRREGLLEPSRRGG
jgi:hypothetical protein